MNISYVLYRDRVYVSGTIRYSSYVPEGETRQVTSTTIIAGKVSMFTFTFKNVEKLNPTLNDQELSIW